MLHRETSIENRPPRPDGGRRITLLRLGALCGLALSGDVLAAVTAGTKPDGAGPKLLSRDELALTAILAEHIIPATSTPGALAVGAHRTIHHLLATCTLPPAQTAFKAGLARIDSVAKAQAGKRYAALPPAHQVKLLQALDTGAAPFEAADMHFFRQLKGYVAFAYYTSEAGATRELVYLPVPGGFNGHVKVSATTRNPAI